MTTSLNILSKQDYYYYYYYYYWQRFLEIYAKIYG